MAAPASPERNRIPDNSGPSRFPSFLRFVNRAHRLVDVIWLNYEGVRIRYKTLAPDGYVDVNTFVGHPWFFRDPLTGEKMVVRSRDMFLPEGHPPGTLLRRLIHITIPMYSLRERCLQEVRRLWTQGDIGAMEIPDILKQDLLQKSPFGRPIMGAYIQHGAGQHIVQLQQPQPPAPPQNDTVDQNEDQQHSADDGSQNGDAVDSDSPSEDEEEVPRLIDNNEQPSSSGCDSSPGVSLPAQNDCCKNKTSMSSKLHKSCKNPMPSSSTQPINPVPSSSTQAINPMPSSSSQQINPMPSPSTQPIMPVPSSSTQPIKPMPSSSTQPIKPMPSPCTQPIKPTPSSGTQSISSHVSKRCSCVQSNPCCSNEQTHQLCTSLRPCDSKSVSLISVSRGDVNLVNGSHNQGCTGSKMEKNNNVKFDGSDPNEEDSNRSHHDLQ